MWWRALGVAAVLLCLGVAGGYAVADRTAPEPAHGAGAEPVPAVSPAVPTPPTREISPDPTEPALQPDLPNHEETLRVRPRRAGVSLLVPDDWRMVRQPSSNLWTFAVPGNSLNTYGLRVTLMVGLNQSVGVAKTARLAALESAEDEGNLLDLDVTTETADGFEATYLDRGYLRLTMERWVAFGNDTAYANVAVTGRSVDEEGLRDLLLRTTDSMQEVEAEQ
jgi:hypothetical protein